MMFDLDCTLLAEMDEILIGEVILDENIFNFSGEKEELIDLVCGCIRRKVPVPLQEMFKEDEIVEESFENEVEDVAFYVLQEASSTFLKKEENFP